MTDPHVTTMSDAERKKLWLDYLGKLNDRASRADQASGMTTWVLIGVVGTLLYSAIPKLQILTAVVRHRALIFLVLAADFTSSFLAVRGIVSQHLLPEYSDIRSASLTYRSLATVASFISIPLFVAFSFLQFYLTSVDRFLPRPLRACLLTFASYWLILVLVGVVHTGTRLYKERKYGIHMPSLNRVPGGYIVFSILAFLLSGGATWSAISAIKFAFTLNAAHLDWITPLGAAAYTYVILTLSFELAAKPIRRITTEHAFAELEQQVIVEDLPPEEIKRRFVEHLLGPSLRQWLSDVSTRLSAEHKEREIFLKNFEDSVVALHSIESMEERVATTVRLNRTIRAQTLSWEKNIRAISNLVPDFAILRLTSTQTAALRPIAAEIGALVDTIKAQNSRLGAALEMLQKELTKMQNELSEKLSAQSTETTSQE